jgi:hypothetical protein
MHSQFLLHNFLASISITILLVTAQDLIKLPCCEADEDVMGVPSKENALSVATGPAMYDLPACQLVKQTHVLI